MAGMWPAAPSTQAVGRRWAGGVPGSCPQMSTNNCGDVRGLPTGSHRFWATPICPGNTGQL